MKIKSSSPGRGAGIDRQRRKLVKFMAAGGASAIAAPWIMQTARAAGRAIKIGMVSPATTSLAKDVHAMMAAALTVDQDFMTAALAYI
jgi:hypothetical protein